jgi:hypothetical protein
MAHTRFRKFNTRDVYEGGRIANDMCMVVRAGSFIFLRGQTGFTLDNKSGRAMPRRKPTKR